jgi:hypothetical protein
MNLKPAVSIISISLVFFLFNAYGGVPESRLLFSITKNTIRLGVINASKQSLDLEIVNKSGHTFLNKTTKSGANYFQMFDVSNLPDGEYVVRLSGGNLDMKKKFLIENRKLKLKVDVEPKFNLVDDQTLLVFYKNPLGKSIDISFERNNEVVFEDHKINETILNKRYSLKQLPRGNYTLRLLVEEESYRYTFEVK